MKFFGLPIKILRIIYSRYAEYECKKQVTIGKNSRFYHGSEVHNLQKDKNKILIGENTHIAGELLIFPWGDGIEIGNNSYVGKNSMIRAAGKITIGNSVLISHNVMIIDTNSHEIDYKERNEGFIHLVTKGWPAQKGNVEVALITIEDYAWISYNVCILKGVTIGKGAIIGAGSVVTKDIPPFTLYAGNPAKFIRTLEIQ
jgi:acetyltransferase-like isoleucine patch superfamily enzyme